MPYKPGGGGKASKSPTLKQQAAVHRASKGPAQARAQALYDRIDAQGNRLGGDLFVAENQFRIAKAAKDDYVNNSLRHSPTKFTRLKANLAKAEQAAEKARSRIYSNADKQRRLLPFLG